MNNTAEMIKICFLSVDGRVRTGCGVWIIEVCAGGGVLGN